MDRITRKDLAFEIDKMNKALNNIADFAPYEVAYFRSYERLFTIEVRNKSTYGEKLHYSFDGLKNAVNYAKRLNKLLHNDRVVVENFNDIENVFYIAK